MQYLVATLGLFALSVNAAFGAISINGQDVRNLDVTTCYTNLRACYWEYSSASQILFDGGLEKLIKQCHVDFAGCDKKALQTAYDIIQSVAEAAGETALVAGGVARDSVNKAIDAAVMAANTAAGIANDAANIASDIANKGVDVAKDAIKDAAQAAKDVINRFKPWF